MQQHPIPQNVTAYEFHLIGNMTLKQFLELGGGIGVGVLFYASNLPGIIKWLFIFLSVGFGAALAFLPFEGRPLDRMIIAFLKAVFSPTQFVWKKSAKPPAYFDYSPKQIKQLTPQELQKNQVRKNLGGFLETLPDKPQISAVDEAENQYLHSVNQLFDQVDVPQTVSTPAPPPKHSSKLKARKLNQPGSVKPVQARVIKSTSINIPEATPVKAAPQAPAQPKTPQPKPQTSEAAPRSTTLAPQQSQSPTTQAVHNQKLPFPTPPTTPNTLVGMVLTADGNIVESAIVEVRDKNHLPVRAFKSNKLGQFFSATRLKDGDYEIEVEKDGLKFDIVKIKLKGKVVPPLEIRASS